MASPGSGLGDSDGGGIVGTALLFDGLADGPDMGGDGGKLAVGIGVGGIAVGVAAGVTDGNGDATREGAALGVLVASGAGISGEGSADEKVL